MKRRIAVITTSRADYGHLYWILKMLAAHPKIDLKLIALGAHLSPQFELNAFRSGRTGFGVMRRLARCCSALFGRRARSHAYVIAMRR